MEAVFQNLEEKNLDSPWENSRFFCLLLKSFVIVSKQPVKYTIINMLLVFPSKDLKWKQVDKKSQLAEQTLDWVCCS